MDGTHSEDCRGEPHHNICHGDDFGLILQHLEGDYGLYTWPCAPVLAQYVYSQRHHLLGKNVIEVWETPLASSCIFSIRTCFNGEAARDSLCYAEVH